jgi:hypothetical protein
MVCHSVANFILCKYAEYHFDQFILNECLYAQVLSAIMLSSIVLVIVMLSLVILGPYSQHSVFFITYESAQYARPFHNKCWKGLPLTNTLTYWVSFLSYE